MPKPVINHNVPDLQSSLNWSATKELLGGGLSIDNFKHKVLTGTTNQTPDTRSLFPHGMKQRPVGIIPMVGDVYAASISNDSIDVRSTKAAHSFAIALIEGPPITDQKLDVSVNTDTSPQVPSVSGGGATGSNTTTIINNTNAGFSPFSPTSNYFVGQTVLTSSAGAYNQVVQDTTCFYITTTGGSSGQLARINKKTGIVTFLALGTALGAMYIDTSNSTLWVSEMTAAAGTVNIYKIDLSAFTSSTLAMTGLSNWGRIADIYVDAGNIYICGGNTSTSAAVAARLPLAGGAATANVILQASGGTAYTATKMFFTVNDGYIYYAIYHNSAVLGAIAALRYNFTDVTTLVLTSMPSTMQMQISSGVVVGGGIYFPAVANTFTSTNTAAYSSGLVIFTPLSGAGSFNFIPMGGITQIGIANGTTTFLKNAILRADARGTGTKLFMVTRINPWLQITAFSTNDGKFVSANYLVPSAVTVSGTAGGPGFNSTILIDTTTSALTYIIPGSASSSITQFETVNLDISSIQ